ncbi:MAG: hypothetical protein AMJ75_01785 [Phycisphaerae bacterium SM1_79]|nr:MAG: hypothetical protein AMJ75_01785 [Phycisphaerae bacterium SM1_79]
MTERYQNKEFGVAVFRKFAAFAIFGGNLILISMCSASVRDGLIGYWPYDGDTLDYSSLGNHGTAFGNPTFVGGKVGSGALDFDGNDYVTMDSVADDFTGNDVTMAAWIKTTTTSEGDWFSLNGTNGQYLLCILGGDIRFYEGGWRPAAGVTVNDGGWHHVVATREDMHVKIYVDGVHRSSASHTSTVTLDPGDRWSIAQEWDGSTPSDFFTGTVDEVAMWDRALTAGETAYLYNDGKGNPPTKGPYVEVSESGGDTVVEEGGATDSYEIVLRSQPTADVEITAAPSDGEIDLGSGPGAAVTVGFLGSDWNVAQTISVTAHDDSVYEGKSPHTSTIHHTAISGDENYDGITISSVKVDVIDNELNCGDWGYLQTDLNRDCYVNLADFAIFAEQWLESGSD